MKGIVSQSVKEVLQSLVDDGLVQADKIGSSNFFWSFPSQRGAMVQTRLKAAKDNEAAQTAQLQEVQGAIEAEKAARPESLERTTALAQLAASKQELESLEKELTQYGACDPAKIDQKRRAVVLAKEAAIRWTDNYAVLLSHFTRQYGVDADEIRKYLGVSDDYEDIC
ncbi:hypothetical protein PHLGIDRAFT_114474 [Phlebiopsis gigantea 11061_1 CR5-6]|uniref:Meiotic nuclear division protein 1 n=1 Tax=Phlebiopsis gigantea (strain 11061_1 CR5-6) TaxID=745531 RepID=A0A0C3PV16_PHLG1|nr:hypothetical protein PHLGIDRAFT_114474 [Phlebiopsis gigantea 11061_1 CR5-6]